MSVAAVGDPLEGEAMKPDVIATVIEIACLTEDRDPEEQRAMLELALWVDNERARFLWGASPVPPTLTELVDKTYRDDSVEIDDTLFGEEPPSRRPVELMGAQRKQLAKLHAKFVPCDRCGVVKGAHAVECLVADLERHG